MKCPKCNKEMVRISACLDNFGRCNWDHCISCDITFTNTPNVPKHVLKTLATISEFSVWLKENRSDSHTVMADKQEVESFLGSLPSEPGMPDIKGEE